MGATSPSDGCRAGEPRITPDRGRDCQYRANRWRNFTRGSLNRRVVTTSEKELVYKTGSSFAIMNDEPVFIYEKMLLVLQSEGRLGLKVS